MQRQVFFFFTMSSLLEWKKLWNTLCWTIVCTRGIALSRFVNFTVLVALSNLWKTFFFLRRHMVMRGFCITPLGPDDRSPSLSYLLVLYFVIYLFILNLLSCFCIPFFFFLGLCFIDLFGRLFPAENSPYRKEDRAYTCTHAHTITKKVPLH